MTAALDSISEIIKKRKSIYPPMYSGQKVEDKIIKQLLENANHAPSHMNSEPWRFHVISDEKLKELATFFQKTYKKYTSAESFKEMKYKKFGKNPILASHVIAIGMHRDLSSGLPEWEEVAAVSCAIQNLYLSVTAADLGGFWSSPPLMINHIDKFINLEKNEKCLGFFYIGVPKDNESPGVKKRDIAQKTKWYY